MKLRNALLMLPLLLAAGHSAALTLGRVRGAALVGQSLDVLVQIQLNADETATALCLEADVFHADTRQDSGRVRVTIEPTAQANSVNARVVSSSFIDEPMVTVYLRAGCAQKISRRYVLLADFPSEPSLPVVAPSVAPAVAAPSGALPAATASPAAAESDASATANPQRNGELVGAPPSARPATTAKATPKAPPKTGPKQRPVARPRPPRAAAKQIPNASASATSQAIAKAPAAAVAPQTQARTTPVAPTPAPAASSSAETALNPKQASSAAGQSRLQLDPLLVVAERAASPQFGASAPASDGMRDGPRDAQRLQSLEDSVKSLVALAAKNEASLQDMRLKVQAAQADRVPVQWLYGLVALVLACLAAMAYLWRRLSAGATTGAGKDDWSRAARNAPPAAPVAMAQEAPTEAQPSGTGKLTSKLGAWQESGGAARVDSRSGLQVGPRVGSGHSSLIDLQDNSALDLDISLVEMTESNFDQLMLSGKSHSAIRPGPLSPQVELMPATTAMQALVARPVNSEQLFDLRQQADFFVSLGQTDQAVQILEKQINDHGETSPLIYLDLLQIFHSLNLKTDFRQFREDFNLLFNARIPEFAAFRNEGKSLEEYPHVLAHITALWSTRKALMVIEASIFRDSLDDRSTPFDLAAFRDLLLLHAIAQSFTVRSEPTSDLAPLRADIAPISKGARLSALTGAAGVNSFDANAAVDLALPTLSGLSELDITLDSSSVGLRPNTSLPSVTGVLNAPTALDPIHTGSVSARSSGSGGLDLELDLNLSGLVALAPLQSASHPAPHTGPQDPCENEISEFSKLLKAQAPAGVVTQAAKSKSAASESGNSGAHPKVGHAADNLLDFDLSSELAQLTMPKPKGGKAKPG